MLTAYAQAMKEVAARFPDDHDVMTMTAGAMINIHAWKRTAQQQFETAWKNADVALAASAF